MNCTQRSVALVLVRMIDMCIEDAEYADLFFDKLEQMLSGMLGMDMFGTEGQDDPRGDQRDGHFDMSDIQGLN